MGPAKNFWAGVGLVYPRHNLNVHDVSIQDLEGHLYVEQHLEMDERLPLKDAHDQVTLLESEIREEVPEVESILTHIESEPSTIERGEQIRQDARLEARMKAVVGEFPEVLDMHDIEVKRVRGHLYVS